MIESTNDLKECIVNYVTETQTIEIVDATFKTSATIKGFDLINCVIEGIFEDCYLVGTEVKNSQVTTCNIENSDITNSKVLSCKVESGDLTNCYFMNGYLNGNMYGGVFRSGKLGPYASMDSEVKVVTDTDNFFDTYFDDEAKSDKAIKGFKK